MVACDFSQPEEVWLAFVTEMNQWELEANHAERACNTPTERQRAQYQTLAAMKRIFQRYCTARARPYGRNGTYRSPPEYNPHQEIIEEIQYPAPHRAYIFTQQNSGFRNRCKYVLLKKGGQWRIDNRRIVYADGTSITNTL